MPAQSVNDIVLKKRGISAEMALRLAKYFSTSAEFWMNLQSAYELATAQRKLKAKVEKIAHWKPTRSPEQLSERLQIRQQCFHLGVGQAIAEGGHLGAAALNHFGDTIVGGGHSAGR